MSKQKINMSIDGSNTETELKNHSDAWFHSIYRSQNMAWLIEKELGTASSRNNPTLSWQEKTSPILSVLTDI